ncbi:MAG: hypothetical protein ACLR5S_01240 [Ruminococcus sp.]
MGTDAAGTFWVKSISCNDWDDRFRWCWNQMIRIMLYVMADEV